ncbi:MAG: hypothetical protein WA771_02865 [Chthoniobacterales bacterium]
MKDFLRETPWNSRAVGMPTYEIVGVGDEEMREIVPGLGAGHYTVRVDPQADKRALHELGFYYCDTALTYFCREEMLVDHRRDDVRLAEKAGLRELVAIADASFAHGHFHRDFNVDRARADERFNRWVEDIHASGDYYALVHEGAVAGFFAYSGAAIILQVNAAAVRGKGLGKAFWTLCCRERFAEGHDLLTSPFSACNVPITNLHIAMGFRLQETEDIYHLVVEG